MRHCICLRMNVVLYKIMSKDALLNPILNTKQIADMLGFQYPQHFLRFFKKQVGCTPKEYKLTSVRRIYI